MPLVQYNGMTKELSADIADDTLNIGILPRTSWGNQHLFNAHVPHPLPEGVTVDSIAVAQEISRGPVPGERLHNALYFSSAPSYGVSQHVVDEGHRI